MNCENCAKLQTRIDELEARLGGTVRKHLPLNLPMDLADGRHLLIRGGNGKTLIARQLAPGPAILEGEEVLTAPGKDGRRVKMKCIKRTKKDATFQITGVDDKPEKSMGPEPVEAKDNE